MAQTIVKRHPRRTQTGLFSIIKRHSRRTPERRPAPPPPKTGEHYFKGRQYPVDSGPYPANLSGMYGNVRYSYNPSGKEWQVWFTRKGKEPYTKGNSFYYPFKDQTKARKFMNELKM